LQGLRLPDHEQTGLAFRDTYSALDQLGVGPGGRGRFVHPHLDTPGSLTRVLSCVGVKQATHRNVPNQTQLLSVPYIQVTYVLNRSLWGEMFVRGVFRDRRASRSVTMCDYTIDATMSVGDPPKVVITAVPGALRTVSSLKRKSSECNTHVSGFMSRNLFLFIHHLNALHNEAGNGVCFGPGVFSVYYHTHGMGNQSLVCLPICPWGCPPCWRNLLL